MNRHLLLLALLLSGLAAAGAQPVLNGVPFPCTPPSIVTHPASATECEGTRTEFSVTANGSGTLFYQWFLNGVALPGATASTHTIPSVRPTDAGAYTVRVANTCGNPTSQVATLIVNSAPVIAPPPQSQPVCAGSSVIFHVAAHGTPPLSYQWRKDGTAIAGATFPSYTIPSAQLSDIGIYSAVVANICGQAVSPDFPLAVRLCGPVITGVSPLIAQPGDILTITGSGFDPVRANNSVAVKNGARAIPLRVIEATATRLRVLVNAVPPDAQSGPIAVATGAGAEAAFVDTLDCPSSACTRQVRVPWLGQPGEIGPPVVLGSLDLRPESLYRTVAGQPVELSVGGLGWVPLPPVWTFNSTGMPAMSTQSVDFRPAPPTSPGAAWVFSEPAANGGVSFVITNDCPALSQVQIQGNFFVNDADGSGGGLDILIPNLIVNARLPALACAQAVSDLLVAAFEQAGLRLQCDIAPLGGSAARLTVRVPGGNIGAAGVMLCFTPADAGLPRPFITGVTPPAVATGDLLTIEGGNFGNNPDDLGAQIINNGRAIALRVLEAADDRIVAQVGAIPPDAVAGPVGLSRGLGGPRGIVDRSNAIVSPTPAWVFASSQTGVTSTQQVTPLPAPAPPRRTPGQPVKKQFFSTPVDATGAMCVVLDANCPPGTKISIEAHFDLMDIDPAGGLVCPVTRLDSWLDGSFTQSGASGVAGGGGDCVNFVRRFFEQIFYNGSGAQFGACSGHPIRCFADPVTGKITLSTRPECGCKLRNGGVMVEYCLPETAPAPPVITAIEPLEFRTGDRIRVQGANFPTDPNDLCLVVVNPNQLLPLRVVSATSTELTVEVGPVPFDAQPGPIALVTGAGSTGAFRPAFADLSVAPGWFFASTNAGVMSAQTVSPIYVPPPPPEIWHHGFLGNGRIYVFLPGPCPPGTKLIVDGHFDIRAANSSIRHADCRLPAVNFPQGGSAMECARRIGDALACGFLQRTGVRLDWQIIPQGNQGALVSLGYPDGAMTNGGLTVRLRPCTEPPLSPCVTYGVLALAHGTVEDNFAGPEPASPRPELIAWLASAGLDASRGYDDEGQVNRTFADSFTGLPDGITKATLRLRLRANAESADNDILLLAFAGTGGALDPARWSAYLGAGNPGPGLLDDNWISPNVAELVLDLSRLPLGNNQFKDLLPALGAKKHLDLCLPDGTSVDYAVLEIESCRCRPDLAACVPDGTACAVVTFAPPDFTDGCCPNQTGALRVSCTPPSGACFPPGTNLVQCTATDAAGRKARGGFRVIVTPANPPTVCATPSVFAAKAGGTLDNFDGPEAASPGAGLVKRLSAAGVPCLKGFDDCTVNCFFAHTFTNLPPCVTEAVLRVRLKGCGDGSRNDTPALSFTLPSGARAVNGWSRYLGAGNAGRGLLGAEWTTGAVEELTLDLSALPNADGTVTDLLPALASWRFLDVVVQNDTAVDYVMLTVKNCCCQPDIVVDAPDNACCAVVNFLPPPFSNDCLPISVVCVPPPNACFPVGATLVQCQATDALGQTGQCSFQVVVRENVKPVILSCPDSIVACMGGTNALGIMPELAGQIVAMDNCTPAGQLAVTQIPPAGANVSGGAVTVIVTDASGNTANCTRPIVVQPCCVPPPSGLALWLPFDESAGPNAINVVGGNPGVLLSNVTRNFAGYVANSLCFDGRDDVVVVSPYPAIDLDKGDLTLGAWMKRDPAGGNPPRVLADKRDSNTGVGFSLFVSAGNLVLQLGDAGGSTNFRDTAVVPADNQWHFVAVSVCRDATNGGRFYLDGNPTGAFNPTARRGSVSNAASFRVGASLAAGSAPWLGCIDEVQLFRRGLGAAEIRSLFHARIKGQCKHRCSVPWDAPLWVGATSAVINATICNPNPAPETYQFSFQSLPPGPRCHYPGPTSFSPATGTVTVAAGGCITFPVTVGAPPGMPCGASACYQMVIAPVGTGERFSGAGSLVNSCRVCARPPFARTNLIVGAAATVGPWTLVNATPLPINLTGARFTAWGPDNQPDRRILRLNGLPPGVPWEVPPGVILPPRNGVDGLRPAATGGALALPLDAQFEDFAPGQTFTILLEADTDGDGEFEALASMEVENEIPTTVTPPTFLAIVHNQDRTVTITWPGSGWTLREADDVLGPWTNSASQTSPVTLAPGGAKKFYHLFRP